MTAVLMDHVTAYAAAVRACLADLPPEQVEDLTDGLEADLAEALEDPRGAVATGEVPLVGGGEGRPAEGGGLIDLTRRFGPAAAYAAELRSAAGLDVREATRRTGARESLRGGLSTALRAARTTAAATLAPALATPFGAWLTGLLRSLRPVWWLVRGWAWWVLALSIPTGLVHGITEYRALGRYVPLNVAAWVTLAGFALLSVSVGRGLGTGRRWTRVLTGLATTAAVVAAPVALLAFQSDLGRAMRPDSYPVYIETPVVQDTPVQDGVVVDGQRVSNLFVYDADGNPLRDVQIFDDRGRQVRTTHDDGHGDWWLPGLDEPWAFAAAHDADGRVRWNVYPLTGAPVSAWTFDDEGDRVLGDGQEARTPPAPFLRAPALRAAATTDGIDATGAGATDGVATG